MSRAGPTSSTAPPPARLATGDWVILARADAGPLGFLGKVTDGEWDPRDDALLRARVETTRSKPLWFAVGDLERVEPSDEADLVEAALARGLVPADRAARLRADLTGVRERTLTFVRSPGLLDRLWAALPTDPAQRTGGLAAFFDEGRRALLDARERRYALFPARAAAHEPAPAPTPVGDWITRVQTYEEAVVRILDALPFEELWTVRARLLGEGPVEGYYEGDSVRATVLQGLLTAAPSLPALLQALPEGTLERLLPLLGYPHLRSGRTRQRTRQTPLADHLLQVLQWRPTPTTIPAPTPAVDVARVQTHEVPRQPRAPAAPAATPDIRTLDEAEAVTRLLALLSTDDLRFVRAQLQRDDHLRVCVAAESRDALVEALARARLALPVLLEALPQDAFRALVRTLGPVRFVGPAAVVVAELLEGLRRLDPPRPRGDAAPASAPAISLAEATARILGVVRGPQLPDLCDRLGVPRPVWSDPGPAREAIVAAGRPLRQLVESLPPRTISHLPFALGLPKLEGTGAELVAQVLERFESRLTTVGHLRLLLDLLPYAARPSVVRDLGAASLPETASLDDLLRALVEADVTPLDVLAALEPGELARAVQRFGLEGAPDPVAELRALLRPTEPRAEPTPAAPPERWPGEGRAVWRALALVRRRELLGLCERLGERPSGSPTELCATLARRVRLADLVRALPEEAALHAARLLGRPCATLDQLAAQLHAVALQGGQDALLPAGPSPRVAPELLLTSLLRPLDLGRRASLVATLGSEAHGVAAAQDLARQLLGGGHGLREVLGALDDAGLVAAAAACGLEVDGASPVWLHAVLVLLDLSSQPPEGS